MDALSLVMASVHLKSSHLACLDVAGDWSLDCVDGKGITAYCALAGGFWYVPVAGNPIWLAKHDIILLPEWHEHRICSSPAIPAIDIMEVTKRCGQIWNPEGQQLGEVIYLHHNLEANSASPVRVLAMFFRAQENEHKVLTRCLPQVYHFSAADERLASSLPLAVQFIDQEVKQRFNGYSAASHRLAEFLFIQLLRSVIRTGHDGVRGWLKGLSSPALSRALAAMHRAPQQRWIIEDLAKIAGMSRSAFAAEFSRILEEPPMFYLRDLRIRIAATMLEQGASVKEAALASGYATSFGFQKVFKQKFGVSPGQWNRDKIS